MTVFDFWSVLLIFGIFQGVFLIVSILSKNISRTNVLLITLIFLGAINLFNYLLFSSGLYTEMAGLIYLNHPFIFLIGPVYFFFIKSILFKKFNWSYMDLIHLVPFIVAVIFHLDFYLQSNAEKITSVSALLNYGRINGNLTSHLYIFIHTFITLIYTYHAHRLLKSWNNKSSNKGKLRIWLRRFNSVFTIYWITNLFILLTLSITVGLSVKTDYIVMFITAMLINVLAFIALNYAKEFNQYFIDFPRNKKYSKSSLSERELKEIILSVQNLMTTEKPYLNADLKISDISKSLSLSANNISQALNQIVEKNFFDFVNEYRFKEMSAKLVNPKNGHYTIYGMALESGFKNKNTAYKVFKQNSSMTPLEFIEAHKS